VAGLEEKCRDLELVVEEMGSTFMSFSDDLLKTRKVDPETIKTTIEAFLRLSQRAAHDPGRESDEPSDEFETSTPNSSRTLVEIDASSSMYTKFKLTNASDAPSIPKQSTELAPYFSPPGLKVPPYNAPVGVDPLYNYGLWGIPSHASPTDGMSAIPYILAGRDSFATRLYFETIVLAIQALRGEAPRDILHSIFRYKFRYVDSKTILSILSGVLNVMLHGTSQVSSHSGTEKLSQFIQEDDEAVKAAILSDLESERGSASDYLSSWEVEGYLKNRWSLGIDSNAVRVHPLALLDVGSQPSKTGAELGMFNYSPMFAPTPQPGILSPEQTILNAQSLVERLSRKTVTIGGGPRWHVKEVDLAVQEFLNENYASR
jgi:hypothetical protein